MCQKICTIALLLLTFTQGRQPATKSSALHDRIIAIYQFSPHTLGPAELDAKSAELDAFWKDVKNAGPKALEDLRAELARDDAPGFFNYDGAQLLRSLSKSHEDRQLALTGISRVDMRDVQRDDYFHVVHSSAVDELD